MSDSSSEESSRDTTKSKVEPTESPKTPQKHKKDRKDLKKHKKRDKKKKSKSKKKKEKQSRKDSTLTASTAATAKPKDGSQAFKKEARQMFQKMAATIDLSSSGVLPSQFGEHEPAPSLKEQIETGSILRDMYHKKSIQLDQATIESQKDFLMQFQEKQMQMHEEIASEIRNPEDERVSSKHEAKLSFRERLMSKSNLAKQYLETLSVSEERARKLKEKKAKSLSKTLPYMDKPAVQEDSTKMDEAAFQRKLQSAIQRKRKEVQGEREQAKIAKERALINDQIDRIARSKHKVEGHMQADVRSQFIASLNTCKTNISRKQNAIICNMKKFVREDSEDEEGVERDLGAHTMQSI